MNHFIRILAYLKKYTFQVLLSVGANLMSILFSLVSLTMIIPFLQLLFDKNITAKTAIPPLPAFQFSVKYFIDVFNHYFLKVIVTYGKIDALLFICLLVAVIFLLKNSFRYASLFFLAPVRNGVVKDIRNELFQKLLSLPLAFYANEKKGDVITRMTSDVQEIEYGIISVLEVTFREPITIVVYLSAMIFMSPELTIFVLGMLLVTGFIVGRIGKSLKRTSIKGQGKLGELMQIIEESISGLRIIKAFTAESFQTEKFEKENTSYFRLMTKMQRRKDLSSPLSEFLGICIVVTVLWFGGKLVLDPTKNLPAESFIGFMLIFSQLIPPAKSFSAAFYNIQKGLASSERIYKILDAENTITEKPDAVKINNFRQSIVLKDVSFAYNNFDEKQILKNINLEVKKGKMIAIVGQSGSGKSTLVNLLPRFYDVQEGEILIDGVNVKDCTLNSLRRLYGVVSQEAILFNDTVFNNISFGLKNVSKEDVIRAAKIANAHDYIMKLENGYDTIIGDRGNKLSGGEKQRLTIARAVLSDPPILILDEATSSLDTESEKLVQDAIYRLMENRTSVVIAHRLSTIQYADEILVMHEGRIVERGNHISLMAKNGIYNKLVAMQQF